MFWRRGGVAWGWHGFLPYFSSSYYYYYFKQEETKIYIYTYMRKSHSPIHTNKPHPRPKRNSMPQQRHPAHPIHARDEDDRRRIVALQPGNGVGDSERLAGFGAGDGEGVVHARGADVGDGEVFVRGRGGHGW